jgi:hypothetical protein
VQEFSGALGRQCVEAQLTIIRLAAPAVLVVRAVIDDEQDARSREALDESVEQDLGLRVDPVEILEEQEQRLDLAFPEQQLFDGLQDPLPALGRVEGGPRGIVDGDIQQRQQWWQQGSSAGSSMRSLAAKRSRTSRGASRSWILKCDFSSSITGRYRVAPP